MGKAKTLTAQELRRVQDYIATRAHAARNRAMLLLTHLAGMRVGEVAALTWGDVVNAEGRVKDEIRLNADQTKGGHPRIVFLSPKLLKELECYVRSVKQRDERLATNEQTQWQANGTGNGKSELQVLERPALFDGNIER